MSEFQKYLIGLIVFALVVAVFATVASAGVTAASDAATGAGRLVCTKFCQ